MAKISIIIPVYNVEKYLQQCIDSLLSQTLSDIEIICIDDASQDASGKILNDYAARDDRMKVIHADENMGTLRARIKGITDAAGQYVMFVDSDDYIDRHLLENLLQVGSYDLVLTGLSCMKDDTCVKTKHVEAGEWTLDDLRDDKFYYIDYTTALHGKLYRKTVIDNYQLRFNENLSYAEDRDFNIKFISHANQVCNVDYAGYYYQIDIVTGLSHKIYDYNLQNDIEYWNQLYQLLCINQANGNFPIKKYMVNKLFNYLVDNLYQISKVRNLRETFKLMSSVHPVVNWNFLKQNKEIIDCPEWMKKMLFLPSAILILLLKYYT